MPPLPPHHSAARRHGISGACAGRAVHACLRARTWISPVSRLTTFRCNRALRGAEKHQRQRTLRYGRNRRGRAISCNVSGKTILFSTMLDGTENTKLTPKQAATMLGVSRNTLIVWRRRKVGPPYFRKVGRIFYLEKDVRDWEFSRPGD